MRNERRTVDIDGSQVRVLEMGTGEPLLFLHGWGLSPDVYVEGLRRLAAEGVRVIAPALPGFGGSDAPASTDLTTYAETVARVLDQLRVAGPVLVVGHSFGGGVALQLATDRPERVRSLTLINSVGGAPGRRTGLIDASWLHWALGALTEISPTSIVRDAPNVLRAFLPSVLRSPFTLARTAALALRVSLADQAKALIDRGLPVLFVWADEDRLIAPGALAHVTASLPSRLVEGKHGWLITDPAEFASVVRDALAVHAAFERGQRGLPLVLGDDATLGDLLPHERRSTTRAGQRTRRSVAS